MCNLRRAGKIFLGTIVSFEHYAALKFFVTTEACGVFRRLKKGLLGEVDEFPRHQVSFVSTGGGASLELLEGKVRPAAPPAWRTVSK